MELSFPASILQARLVATVWYKPGLGTSTPATLCHARIGPHASTAAHVVREHRTEGCLLANRAGRIERDRRARRDTRVERIRNADTCHQADIHRRAVGRGLTTHTGTGLRNMALSNARTRSLGDTQRGLQPRPMPSQLKRQIMPCNGPRTKFVTIRRILNTITPASIPLEGTPGGTNGRNTA